MKKKELKPISKKTEILISLIVGGIILAFPAFVFAIALFILVFLTSK
jgi:hypothetical protein